MTNSSSTRPLDVVPVNPTTVDQWIHPPYSGYFDGRSKSIRVAFSDFDYVMQAKGSGDEEVLMTRVGSLVHCGSPAKKIVLLVLILEQSRSSVESLIEGGFKPTRTVVLSYGFDEEISGCNVWLVYARPDWKTNRYRLREPNILPLPSLTSTKRTELHS